MIFFFFLPFFFFFIFLLAYLLILEIFKDRRRQAISEKNGASAISIVTAQGVVHAGGERP